MMTTMKVIQLISLRADGSDENTDLRFAAETPPLPSAHHIHTSETSDQLAPLPLVTTGEGSDYRQNCCWVGSSDHGGSRR